MFTNLAVNNHQSHQMPLCLSEIPIFFMVSNPFIAWKPSCTSSPGRSSRTSAGPEPVPSVQGMPAWKLTWQHWKNNKDKRTMRTQWGWLTSQKFYLPIFEDVHSLFQHIPSVRKVRKPWWPKSSTNYLQRCTIYDCKKIRTYPCQS